MNFKLGNIEGLLNQQIYMAHPAAINDPSAATLYPARNGGIATFAFLRVAISFPILSYLALRPAQSLAEALDAERVVCLELAGLCFLVAVVLESVVVGIEEAIFVFVVAKAIFFALDIKVLGVFVLIDVVVVLDVVFTGLKIEVLGLVEAIALPVVLLELGLVELVEAVLVEDGVDKVGTIILAWTVVTWAVLFAALEPKIVGTVELEGLMRVLELGETEAVEDETEMVKEEEEVVREEEEVFWEEEEELMEEEEEAREEEEVVRDEADEVIAMATLTLVGEDDPAPERC